MSECEHLPPGEGDRIHRMGNPIQWARIVGVVGVLTCLLCLIWIYRDHERQEQHGRLVPILMKSPGTWNDARRGLSTVPLSGIRLEHLRLDGLDLSGADMSGAELRDVVLSNCSLWHADLHGSILEDVRIEHTEASGLDLSSATVRRTTITDSNLRGFHPGWSSMESVVFDRSNLTNVGFYKVRLKNVTIVRSSMRDGGVSMAVELTNFTIQASDITNFGYRGTEAPVTISIIDSHPCGGVWREYCK